MGWLSDKLFGKRKSLDMNKLNQYMQPTQDLVNEQIGYGRDLMDPNSQMNMAYKNHLQQQMMQSGQNIGSQVQKIGAMRGVSPAQAMMQARMGMNQSMGQGQGNLMNWMQGQQQAGFGLLGNMTGMMQGLNENQANAYVQQINAHNARRSGRMNMFKDLSGMAISGWAGSRGGTEVNQMEDTPEMNTTSSDIRLKENIELVGKSLKGINIYEFDYKDKSFGKGRYRGVMAQEVPNASTKGYDGYLRVNYNKLDVDFERIN
jgi:hypothetical protein